jgi:hypothetical protein
LAKIAQNGELKEGIKFTLQEKVEITKEKQLPKRVSSLDS